MSADNRSSALRSKTMSAVWQKDTGPEMTVRRLLHGMGYRYRLHRKELLGRSDIVYGPRKKVVFVHGCFWPGHGCAKGQLPKSCLEYWAPKIAVNNERDIRRVQELYEIGWDSRTVWQCVLTNVDALARKLDTFRGGDAEVAA